MAKILFLLLFACFICCLFLGTYILSRDRKAATNQAFFLLCITISCWAFAYAFMLGSANSYTANLWRLAEALGWCFFPAAWLEFAIANRYKDCKIEKKMSNYQKLCLYLPPLLFYIHTIGYAPEETVRRVSNAFCDVPPENFIEVLFVIYYVIFVISGIIIFYKWGRDSKLKREKKQANIIISATLITLVLGTFTDSILPLALNVVFFPLSVIAASFTIAGILYAVRKYKLMAITPEYVSGYIFKEVNNPIFFIGEDFLIKDANDVALKMTGYDFWEIKKYSFDTLVSGCHCSFPTFLQKGTVSNIEVTLAGKGGIMFECILSGTAIYDEFKDMLGVVIILQDISDRKNTERMLQSYNLQLENKVEERTQKLEEANRILKKEISDRVVAEEKIRYMGYHDELTGLPNRRYFNEFISNLIRDMEAIDGNFAVMFLDFDNFKMINDTFGHHGGDSLLKHYANLMRQVIREGEVLARIGGDEFLILVTNLSEDEGEKTVRLLSQRVMDVFREPFIIDGKENFLTTSIGAAFYPEDGANAETLIMNADIAMYEAKTSGKNAIKICTPEIKNKVMKKSNLRSSLYRAIDKEELSLYYQPQVDIGNDRIAGFEALLRWRPNNESFVSPAEFIPLAEETGLIIPIGDWVIRTAFNDLKKWHNAGFEGLSMAVNISINQLNENKFIDRVQGMIADSGLDPRLLEFEITERVILKGNETAMKNLEKLKKMGVKISIDDFGIEYSSFVNLKRISIDRVKIAMDFIQDITRDKKDAVIVSSIIELSHSMGLDVVAEGVETREQLEYLQSKKCDVVQGYYYYRPMPGSDIENILKYTGEKACNS